MKQVCISFSLDVYLYCSSLVNLLLLKTSTVPRDCTRLTGIFEAK